MKFKSINLLAVTLIASALAACNSSTTTSTFLQSTDVKLTAINNDSYIQLTSVFNIGNVSLSEVSVSVIDPKTQQNVGTATFSQLPNQQGQITLNVNASLILDADPDTGLLLPNGNPIPLSLGAQHGDVMGVNILNSSRVYVGGDLKTAVYAGVALTIPGLDQVMSQIPTPANIFYQGTFQNVLGIAGIYTSPSQSQSGIAVFGKYTPTSAALQTQSLDANQDNDLNKLDTKTKTRLYRFFHGKRRHLTFD